MFGFDIEYRQMMRDLEDEVEDVRLPDKDLVRLGMRARRLIRKRTKKGIDYQGEAFEAYSEMYEEVREAAGRPTDRVTLMFENIMLANLTAVAADGTALLRFASSDAGRIANYHNNDDEPRSVMPLRRFLDVIEGTDEYDKLSKMAASMYADQIGN